eukprot:NODE_19_length_47148_cov_1.447810.p12 type:complete len:343 gc:universal NODE_19_length_47148_cov_1.447810:30357-31385(+)
MRYSDPRICHFNICHASYMRRWFLVLVGNEENLVPLSKHMYSDILQYPNDPYSGAVSCVDGSIQCFDYDFFEEKVITSTAFRHCSPTRSLCFNESLFCCTKDSKIINIQEQVYIYDFQIGSPLYSLHMESSFVGYAGDEEGNLIIFDIRQSEKIKAYKLGNDFVSSLCSSPFALYASLGDGSLNYIDIKANKVISSDSLETTINGISVFKKSIATVSDLGIHYFEKNAMKYSKVDQPWIFYDYVPADKIGELEGLYEDSGSIYVYGSSGVWELILNPEQKQVSDQSFEYVSIKSKILFGTNYDKISMQDLNSLNKESYKDSKCFNHEKVETKKRKPLFINLD